MTARGISQKEYLKKYLSVKGDDKKKKKKKSKAKPAVNRLRIVDDDIDIHNMRPLDDDELELYDLQEDAPQIAGIIDERPEEVKIKERYGSKKWKVVADENDDMGVKIIDKSNPKTTVESGKHIVPCAGGNNGEDMSPPRKGKKDSDKPSDIENSKLYGSGNSPTGKGSQSNDSYVSDPHKIRKSLDRSPVNKRNQRHDSDESPPRKSRKSDSEYVQIRKDHHSFDESPPKRNHKINSEGTSHWKKERNSIADESPPQKNRNNGSQIMHQERKRQNYDSDYSPPRKNKADNSPPRKRQNNDSDESPPRHKKRPIKEVSPYMKGHKYDSDTSPPRKNRKNSSENSQSRKNSQKYDSDESPPRKTKQGYSESPQRKNIHSKSISKMSHRNEETSPRRRHESPSSSRMRDHMGRKPHRSDSDESPPRRRRKESLSPGNRGKKRGSGSPPKREREKKRLSRSPTRNRKGRDIQEVTRKKSRWGDSDDISQGVQKDSAKYRVSPSFIKDGRSGNSYRKEFENEPKRDGKNTLPQRKSESEILPAGKSKQTTNDDSKKQTLDGRKAGLVGADELKNEIAALRHREKEIFEKMDATVSGRDAAPIVRDRKTGKKRDLEEEAKEKQEKDEKQAERDAKYMQWGKGLKQVSDKAQKMEADLQEMSKPLARYADDEDLDKYLRDQEREGDPMLQYIRSKSKSQDEKGKQRYEGSFMPNRFGIRPGFRWDGVDRSSGYEKQWFETQNAKKAVEDEAYKWSTADM